MVLRNIQIGLVWAVMLATGGGLRAAEPMPVDIALKSVVRVRTLDRSGSGFLVKHAGIVVTSLSLVQGSDAATAECSDGEVLSVTGVVGVDTARDLVVLRLSDLSNCPPLRFGADSVKQGARVWVLALPDNSGAPAHESRIEAITPRMNVGTGRASMADGDGETGSATIIELAGGPPGRYLGSPLVNQDGVVVGVCSRPAEPLAANGESVFISSVHPQALIGDLLPRPVPLAELPHRHEADPFPHAETGSLASTATKQCWDQMTRILGDHVVSHHKWCVKYGFREPVLTPADIRAAKSEKRASEEGEARERSRLRGLGFDPWAIMAHEARVKSSAEYQKATQSLLEIGGIQKSTARSLEAVSLEGVHPELAAFIAALARAYREAGGINQSYGDRTASPDEAGDSEAGGSASEIQHALDRISQLRDVDGVRLRARLAEKLGTSLGPVTSLSAEEWKLVSGQSAAEMHRIAAAEAEASKLWSHYDRARSNGGGEKTLRYIIEKFPDTPSAQRAQQLLDGIRPK